MNDAKDLLRAARGALTLGDVAEAVHGYLAAAAAYPYDKNVAFAAASGLRACGDARAAAAVLEVALLKMQGSVGLLEAAAEAYTVLGMASEAAAHLTRAAETIALGTTSWPNDPTVWINLAKLRKKLDQEAETAAAVQRAADLLCDPAKLQFAPGTTAAVEDLLRQILAINPMHPTALTLLHQNTKAKDADAVALLQRAWEADKAHGYVDARRDYNSVLRQSPGHAFALSRLLTMDGIEGRLDEADTHHRQLVEALAEADVAAMSWMHLAVIAYQSVLRPLPQDIYNGLAAEIDRQLTADVKPPAKARAATGRRLRVGYVSTFFRDHPVGHVTSALFAAHDRSRFEVHVFYLPDGPPTAFTLTIAAGAEHFITLPDTAEGAIKEIAARDLDVLIYIDGYMSIALLPVVAARPARRQMFWLGHAGNCDISAIDYLIADATVVPPEDEALYSAKVVRLPVTFHCASPHPIAPTMSRAAAGLPEKGFVFCAFNNPEKIDRTVFDVWMRILSRVEDSVLWLSRTLSPAVADNMRAAAATAGIAPARLIFAGRVADKAEHLARHRLCGLFLDTLTLNASTTALDALWAGLPVLTVHGARFGSRLATSYLRALDLEELIAPTVAAYEERAVYLATQAHALDAIHTQLAANRESRPLFKIDAFCRAMEACLEGMGRA